VGTFTLFQETYHRPTFQKMHISGPKSDFDHRLLTQDRAFRGGIDDVGIGTLFGLYDYRCKQLCCVWKGGAGDRASTCPALRAVLYWVGFSASTSPVDKAVFLGRGQRNRMPCLISLLQGPAMSMR
jgi:hypothetical protein